MRVSAGRLRGRRLHTPAGRATRPTSERARMGLFAWVGPRVAGARVLDLFAGTGALGIEALSRGAEQAVFVESAGEALRSLRRNREELQLCGSSRLLARDTRRALTLLGEEGLRFDLVFADPPYGARWPERLATGSELVDLLAPGGVLLIERARRTESVEAHPLLRRRGTKTYGETAFDWYERAREEDE